MVHRRIKDVMTRALTIILVLALPVLAEEKKADKTTATTTAPATATAAGGAQPDSPLVAAAKRANRLGKKSATPVITNATLKSSGANAHVTTTAKQTAIQMPAPLLPPRETPEMAVARTQQAERAKAAVQAEAERKAKEEQQKKMEAAAAASEEGFDGMQDDAAEFTGTTPPPPQF
jgi:hypothetical protein